MDRADERAVTTGAAISELHRLAAECAQDGWDGEAGSAVDPMAVAIAEDFLRALPPGISLPELALEPDGALSLDWTASQHRRFTLSIGRTNRLAYAWLDGSEVGHGVANFSGATVPSRILDGLHGIMNHACTSLRAA
ncbi:MAG TPA: hypothetical protein PLX89_21260 [Verrucomicrobiota bacterium]|nr:hypothetical protein [Verrucomicrobiales bacterium]HRI15535.1 hypothetical protein [Verrucomicrobiota bacterium]